MVWIGDRSRCACTVVVLVSAFVWPAAGETVDKDQFHLFDPTPTALMRPLTGDRPDTTESPFTVDAGHLQVESSFVAYSREDGDAESVAILPSNFRIGLLNDVELQIVVEPYVRVENGQDADGFGATQLRMKINFWGNDGGETAFAFMPFIQFPTADDGLGSDEAEGGLIFPFATDLSDRLGLGLMFEIDFVYDDEEDDYDLELLHTAVLGAALTEQLGAYLEYAGIEPTDEGDYLAFIGAGLTYALDDNTQLDVGTNVGLTDEAADFEIFSGIIFRI